MTMVETGFPTFMRMTDNDKLKLWGGLAAGSVALRLLLPAEIIERFYSRGIFIGVRYLIDYTVGWLPVPLFYVFWLLIIWWAGRWIWARTQGQRKSQGWLKTLVRSVLILVTVFLWIWGFNYGRLPVETSMGFSPAQPTLARLRSRVYTEAAQLASLRQCITPDTFALTAAHFPDDLEAEIRPLLAMTLLNEGFPAPARPAARRLRPEGVLLRFSTAGVYWPWAGQGNIDAGLHPIQQPSVMAHELSHAYGFGDEGTCSFLAWLTHYKADDPSLAYALRLGQWRRLAGRLRQAEPRAYWRWRAENLAPGIRQDLTAIYENSTRFKDIAPVIRDAAYDTYLKAQGVHEGLLNYGRVVQLVEGYLRARENGDPPPAGD